jgi:hypothetical protein
MNGKDSTARQVIVVIVGFGVLLLSLLILYGVGTPVLGYKDGPHKDLFDFASYVFPCAAAICAGAGLFLKYPSWLLAGTNVGIQKEPSVPVKEGDKATTGRLSTPVVGGGPGADETVKSFFVLSLLLLYLGLLAYAGCHPCGAPSVTLIFMIMCWTLVAVLRLRGISKTNQLPKKNWFSHYLVDFLVFVLGAITVFVIYGFSSMFSGHICSG